jgi:Mg-chelatase subunit ChlD
MSFDQPLVLLLAIPAAAALLRARDPRVTVNALRAVTMLLLVAALAGPRVATIEDGLDVLLVVDRSASMPAGGERAASDAALRIAAAASPRDRLGIVTFGADPKIERAPAVAAGITTFAAPVDTDGSDLGSAIELAATLVPTNRQGALIVISDGADNGRDPLAAARSAASRAIPIFTRTVALAERDRVAILDLDVPDRVAVAEPYQIRAMVHASEPIDVAFRLLADGVAIASGRRELTTGTQSLLFRDLHDEPGIRTLRLELSVPGDGRPGNDHASAALAIGRPRSILVVNHDGAESAVSAGLRGAGLEVHVAAPERLDPSPAGLARHRAVVLENVALDRLGAAARTLVDFVEIGGGGLMITGGRASFGVGGYHRSALDPLLPLSLELRADERKSGLALAVALDRSGSMAAAVATGGSKMDLANSGTIAAIRLLSPIDSVAVIAVDSASHVVVSLTDVDDPLRLSREVAGIEAGGGGIFVRTGFETALEELADASQANRHVVIFADAADAEEQEGCLELAEEAFAAGVTTSVIALGSRQDSDAAFLEQLAAAGGGELHVTSSPQELPRLFAQDTILASRSTFVTDATGVAALPELLGLGDFDLELAPLSIHGFNRCYPRPAASLAMVTTSADAAPILAHRNAGLGRVVALTAQVGGEHGQALATWSGLAGLLATLARFLVGSDASGAAFTEVRRTGLDHRIGVEFESDAAATVRPIARIARGDGTRVELPLERVGSRRFEARLRLASDELALGAIDFGGGSGVSLPPLLRATSPEHAFELDPRHGGRQLARIAALSGGAELAVIEDVLALPARSSRARSATPWLALAALVLLLLEIAERRLAPLAKLAAMLRVRRRPSRAVAPRASAPVPEKAPRVPDVVELAPEARPPDVAERPRATGDEDPLAAAARRARRRLDR